MIDEAHKQGMQVHAYFEKGIKIDKNSPIFDTAKEDWKSISTHFNGFILLAVHFSRGRLLPVVQDLSFPDLNLSFGA
jgi:hypothetical protein